MPGRTFVGANGYRYGFNGKENDNEVKGNGNQQDYGLRIYDPRLGRFLSIDPIGNKFPFYSPYQYSGNSPIEFIDLDGAEPQLPLFEKYKYGNSVALNSIKAVPNAAATIVNGGIGLLNTAIYNGCMYAVLGPGAYSENVANSFVNKELPAAKAAVSNSVAYFSETSIKQMGIISHGEMI